MDPSRPQHGRGAAPPPPRRDRPLRPGPSRRDVVKSAAALSLAAAVGACGGPPAPTRRPNVLYVFSDAHRACSTGCYGNDVVRTPHIDRLAREGALLRNAVSSTPQCRPYRASLMSGLLAHHHGMLSNGSDRNFSPGLPDAAHWTLGDLPTLGGSFRDAGYRCGYVGKWHLGDVNLGPGPRRLGFDDSWAAAVGVAHDYWSWQYYTGPDELVEGGGRFRPTMETDLALDFIDQADERPWLLMLSWGPPHEPFDPPEAFRHYGEVPVRPNLTEKKGNRFGREDIPLYYGLIEALDAEFGRLLEHLDRRGLARDTIVVYTSDHGAMLGSHSIAGKEWPQSESSQVPFVLRWPGQVPAASAVSTPFGAPDVMPTLLGLADIAPPGGLDGLDLSPVILGRADGHPRGGAYLMAPDPKVIGWPGWRGVRTERGMYACRITGPWMLFDHEADPYEMDNLVGRGTAFETEMQELTRALMDASGDGWPG